MRETGGFLRASQQTAWGPSGEVGQDKGWYAASPPASPVNAAVCLCDTQPPQACSTGVLLAAQPLAPVSLSPQADDVLAPQ